MNLTPSPPAHLAQDQFINVEPRLHVREWAGEANRAPFLLVHGLASNARLWDGVGARLAASGHRAVAVDLRGHGLSDKPDEGYDFATVAGDLARLMDAMELARPIIAGQSWGGNVALAFGVLHPTLARGLCFVDGGFLDIQSRPGMTWERTQVDLRPPPLAGTPLTLMRQRIREFHPDWSDEGIEGVLANFEVMPDETVRPWLTIERHLQILHALWSQRPAELYPQSPGAGADLPRARRQKSGVDGLQAGPGRRGNGGAAPQQSPLVRGFGPRHPRAAPRRAGGADVGRAARRHLA